MSPIMAPAQSRHLPRTVGRGLALATALVLAVTSLTLVAPPAGAAPNDPPTVVSLTFDDGNSDQMAAAAIMKARNMPGTFYINSGAIGMSGFLTRDQLTTLAADGHEIGGHTLNHTDLTTLPTDEARRQICLDRANLHGWGLQPRSFAYPFAVLTPTVRGLVAECGYNSARGLGDIESRFGCVGCPHAETVPPSSPYETKALDQVDSTWTLQDFKDAVTNAESDGGGWVQLTFHNFCGTVCTELSVTESVFTQFLDWLALRKATNNTSVKTVSDVVGGTVKPPVTTSDPTPPTDPSGLNNPSFESVNDAGFPMCWQQAAYGTNTATYTTASPGRTGDRAGQVTVSGYGDGDAKLLPSLDLGTCAPAVTAGTSYVLNSWYTTTGATQYAVYLRNTAGGWEYWTSSPDFATASTWTQATWTTAAVPAGYTAISFGLNLHSNGTLTSDDYSIAAVAVTPVTPVTSATVSPAVPDGTAGWYVTTPTVTLDVTSGSTPDTVRQYSFDGTTWITYSAPFQVPDGTTTVSYRSTTGDTVEATRTLTLTVDSTAPTVTPTFDPATRTVNATAGDVTSGAGQIQYREGTGPWGTFAGPMTAGPEATTLEFRVTDAAGNVSPVKTLNVPAALVSTASVSPAAPDGTNGWYTTQPTVTISKPSGSTATLEYSFTGDTWTTYVGPIQVPDGISTLRHRAVDGDETETAHAIELKVDTVKPVVTTTLTGRTVDATALDGTSGLASLERRVDGGAWTAHTTATTVGNGASTVDFRATDKAGNVSPIGTVDVPAAPTTSANVVPAAANGSAGWYKTKPTITLMKGSGPPSAVTEYSIDGGSWTTYTAPIELGDGTPTLRYRTRNGDEIEDSHPLPFKIDTAVPTVTPSFDKTTRQVSATAADGGSGIDRIERRLAGGDWTRYPGRGSRQTRPHRSSSGRTTRPATCPRSRRCRCLSVMRPRRSGSRSARPARRTASG